MAQEYEKLDLNERIDKGKSKARSLRRDGMVPGIYYFRGKQNVNLQIDQKKLYHFIFIYFKMIISLGCNLRKMSYC